MKNIVTFKLCEGFLIQGVWWCRWTKSAQLGPTNHQPPLLLCGNINTLLILHYWIVLKNYLAFLSRIYSFVWGIYFSSWAWLGFWEESPLAVDSLLLIKGFCDMKGQPFPIAEALSWCLQLTSRTGMEIPWFFALFIRGSVLFLWRVTTVYELPGLLRDCRNKRDGGWLVYYPMRLWARGGISALVQRHDMRSAVTFKRAGSVSQGSW